MIKNIKQWKTTSIGLVIIASCIVSMFINPQLTWTDTAVGLAIGLGLVFSPDTIIDKAKDLFKIFILVFLSSCMSEKKLAKICSDKYPVRDSIVIIEKIDTTYEYIQGDSIKVPYVVNNTIRYIDTICPPKKVQQIVKWKEKTIYQENTAKSSYLTYILDSTLGVNKKQKEEIAKQQDKISGLRKFKNWTISILTIILLLIILRLYLKTLK